MLCRPHLAQGLPVGNLWARLSTLLFPTLRFDDSHFAAVSFRVTNYAVHGHHFSLAAEHVAGSGTIPLKTMQRHTRGSEESHEIQMLQRSPSDVGVPTPRSMQPVLDFLPLAHAVGTFPRLSGQSFGMEMKDKFLRTAVLELNSTFCIV